MSKPVEAGLDARRVRKARGLLESRGWMNERWFRSISNFNFRYDFYIFGQTSIQQTINGLRMPAHLAPSRSGVHRLACKYLFLSSLRNCAPQTDQHLVNRPLTLPCAPRPIFAGFCGPRSQSRSQSDPRVYQAEIPQGPETLQHHQNRQCAEGRARSAST